MRMPRLLFWVFLWQKAVADVTMKLIENRVWGDMYGKGNLSEVQIEKYNSNHVWHANL